MSRRPDNKAAQNQQTIKGLLKLEANKMCADCKKNKHPRWASWNLGVFVCIRCSGIHRGMGTHISRVKSVDLDAWTDEQLQSIVRWGNARANKYWEAKLAAGHVPSDGKIENFIRTKYESKRWVMDGPMPDPSTLGSDGDDNVPLNVVRDKAQLDRSASQRNNAPSSAGLPPPPGGARRAPMDSFDLIGADDPAPPPPRPATTDTPPNAARAPPAAPKASTPSQLLGGLDFLGDTPERPASGGAKSAGLSRPDLKQSILSLYAAQPKPPPQSPPTQTSFGDQSSSSFGGMGGSQPNTASSGMGGMNDAFAGLSFGSSSTSQSKPNPPPANSSSSSGFGGLGGLGAMSSPPVKSNPAPPHVSSPPLGGGGFFDTGPKPPPKPSAPKSAAPVMGGRKISNASDGFGDFTSSSNTTTNAPPAPKSSGSAGLLDFTQTMVNIKPVSASKPTSPPTNLAPVSDSVFNLSSMQTSKSSDLYAGKPSNSSGNNFSSSNNNNNNDPWGSNEWATPDPAPAPSQQTPSATTKSSSGNDFGWGSPAVGGNASSGLANEWSQPATATSNNSGGGGGGGGWGSNDGGFGSGSGGGSGGGFQAPKVTAEEDFGGWGAAPAPAPTQPTTTSSQQPSGSSSSTQKSFGGGSDDLFSNVWG